MTENDIIKNEKNTKTTTDSRKKIQRTFSNPFRWSRKYNKMNKDNNYNENNKNDSLNNEIQQNTTTNSISITTTAITLPTMGVASVPSTIESTDDKNIQIIDNKDLNKETIITSQQQQQNQSRPTKDNYLTNNFANRVFRRSSFRKFLLRIAHHVSSIGANKYASQSNGGNPAGGGVGVSTGNNLSSDRVPPIGGYQWPPDQTPGVTGLKNHGNTCFMNAVLQCLSHTDILAEYFVLDQYKADLKRRNKINSKKFGTKGELTEQLANVLKALWTCKNETDHSTSFKAVVDRYGTQFRSSTQHDAQEFLFWLLDKVHEDLNTASKRRYKTVKNYYGRPDEIIAAETLANHIRCNNSFVQAVFQAQFRSSLTCPRCKKQSNTFDPFHCISVQLPQLAQQTIFVTVLYVKQHPKQVKLGLTVPAGSPIIALRERLNADTGISTNRMVLADINETGFSRVFYDSQPIATLNGINTIYCIEIPEIKDENSTDLMLLIANVKKTNEGTVERFGTPFCIQVNRDCSYIELQKKLLKEMSSIVKPEVFAYTIPLNEMFQIRLQDPSADPDTYLEQVEHPLFMEIIDMALSVLSSDAGPSHIKLLLEWTGEPDKFFSDLSDPVVEHESVSILKMKKTNESSLTLEQCLEHYTKAEMLSAEDAWRCPNCQQYLPVVKTLGLWSLPDILVIHFKRFRQQHEKGPDSAKLTTMVKFPLNSFDMSPHLARTATKNSTTTTTINYNNDEHRNTFGGSPWRKSFNFRDNYNSSHHQQHKNKDKEQTVKDNRYDLYAVCYHQGDTLETGHYTAACKNPYDHQWYKFDDQRVSLVQSDNIQDEIVNNEAYILFYQRRNNDNLECSAGSSSTTSGDHWISRIAPAPIAQLPLQQTVQQSIPIQQLPSSPIRNLIAVAGDGITIPPTIPTIPIIEDKNLNEELPKNGSTVKSTKLIKDNNKLLEQKQEIRNIISAVVIEKTDENEEVDIESFEFVDNDEENVSRTTTTIKENEILKIPVNENKSLSTTLKVLNEDKIIRIKTADIPNSINDTNVISINNNSAMKNSDINNSNNSNNINKLLNGHKETINKNDLEKITLNNKDKLLIENNISENLLTNGGGTCIWPTTTIIPNSKSPSSESISSQLSQRFSVGSSSGGAFGGFGSGAINLKEVLSTSLRSNHSGSGISGYLDSSSSFGSNNCVNLRHSFSTSSNYKLKDCDTISLLRANANTCSKDTLMYIDQQGHNLMDNDDDSSSFLGSRSLWISPVTPHKLVTVSPKN